MRSVALKGLAARKVRAVLTALAVVIGVAMVSGTFILTDTTLKSFTGLFTASTAKTDAFVRGKEVVKNSTNGSGITIPASVLTKVQRLPQVAAAAGEVSPQEANAADIIGPNGKVVAKESVAGSYDAANARFSAFRFKTGKAPQGSGEVAIDAGTASKKHYEVGDSIVVAPLGKKHTYKVSGTVSYGSVDSLGFASIAVWDTKTAQSLLNREGRYDSLSIAAKKGTSSAALVRAIKPLLPANLEVKDSAQQAKADAANINDGLKTIRLVLLGFGGIALLVGAFVIFNTLSITVAQRTREFATLRTLGASRKQVKRSVVLEGLVIGLIASLLGLVAGYGIAKGMVALISALGLELPKADTVVATRTIVVSMLVGTGITVLASILPARRATRVPPIAAVREGSVLPRSRFAAYSARTGVGVVTASLAAMAAGLFAGGVSGAAMALLITGGVLGLFLGIALLAPSLVKPLARVVGWPARRAGGVAGDLAGANAVRNPSRTAATAAALMIGLTLVTVVAVLGSGINAGTKKAITDQLHAGYVVDGNGGLPFRADEGDKLAATPGVKAASQVRSDEAIVQGKENTVTGIDPATIAHFYTFNGRHELRAHARAARDRRRARRQELRQGQAPEGRAAPCRIKTPKGDKHTVVVRGIYDPPEANPLLADVSCHQKAFDSAYASRRTASRSSTRMPTRRRPQGGGQGLRRRQVPHRRRVPEGRHQGHGDGHGDALRAAGLLGDREPVRHGQHDGALGVRAHPRDRHAADDRHDAPPGAPHDPPRERHHGADRRRARPRARAVPVRAGDPGSVDMDGLAVLVPVPRWSRSRCSPSSPGSARRSSRHGGPRA